MWHASVDDGVARRDLTRSRTVTPRGASGEFLARHPRHTEEDGAVMTEELTGGHCRVMRRDVTGPGGNQDGIQGGVGKMMEAFISYIALLVIIGSRAVWRETQGLGETMGPELIFGDRPVSDTGGPSGVLVPIPGGWAGR